jgi:hypothetical protein
VGETAQFKVGNMFVVEQACQFAADRSTGTIVVESTEDRDFPKAIGELGGTDARNLALGFAAQQGVADPRVNGTLVGPYPVNQKGIPIDKVADENGQPLPPAHPDMQPSAYRVDVPVCRRLV